MEIIPLTTSMPDADILHIQSTDKEIVRIAPDGNVYWNGRLIESDDDFKAALLDLVKVLKGNLWNSHAKN